MTETTLPQYTVGTDEQGRNIGCCGLAAATTGREHYPTCANGERS